jgi:hypothetical protein
MGLPGQWIALPLYTYIHTVFYCWPTREEIHSVHLPVCTVATAVKATCKCCGRVFGCNMDPPNSQAFLSIRQADFKFLIWGIYLLYGFTHCILPRWQGTRPHTIVAVIICMFLCKETNAFKWRSHLLSAAAQTTRLVVTKRSPSIDANNTLTLSMLHTLRESS